MNKKNEKTQFKSWYSCFFALNLKKIGSKTYSFIRILLRILGFDFLVLLRIYSEKFLKFTQKSNSRKQSNNN